MKILKGSSILAKLTGEGGDSFEPCPDAGPRRWARNSSWEKS